jgi:hypothetical protein
MTQKQKVEQFDAVHAESWRNHFAMQALYSNSVMWSKWVKEPDSTGKYRLGVFGLDGANGGACITVFEYPNQTPQMTVHPWEQWQAEVRTIQQLGSIYSQVYGALVADIQSKLYELAARKVA